MRRPEYLPDMSGGTDSRTPSFARDRAGCSVGTTTALSRPAAVPLRRCHISHSVQRCERWDPAAGKGGRILRMRSQENGRTPVLAAIIGGGIGGLAVALALQRIGVSVKVFEK